MPDRADPPAHAAAPIPLLGWAIAGPAAALAAYLTARYPLAPTLVAASLLLYAAVLWRWPRAWLVAVPAALAGFDLVPWAGGLGFEESDLVVLVTLAVLALRAPPRRADFRLSRLVIAAVALAGAALIVGVVEGLLLPGPAGGSDLAELRPDTALRVAKGFAIALALLPFLRRDMAESRDGIVWLAWGMAAGLAIVAAAALVERVVFTGLFDLHTQYRIVATFSSMHLGGGYVGVFVAMAAPFLFVLLARGGWAARLVAAAIMGVALYTLVVTFARAAYGSAALGGLVLAIAAGLAGWRRRPSVVALVAPAVILVAIAGIVFGIADRSRFIAFRLARFDIDLATRERSWGDSLRLDAGGTATLLLGHGIGTYARTIFALRPRAQAPTNFVLSQERGAAYLAIDAGLPLYIGQKVAVAPDTLYRLSVALRSPDGRGRLDVVLCEKLLLYSARCRGVTVRPERAGDWEQVSLPLPSAGLGERLVLGFLHRPIELSFFLPLPSTALDVADLRLTDPGGRELVANGGFADGLARWFTTDDDHTVWRIENQYLMSLFEGGALGLAALIVLAATALRGAARATLRGDLAAAATLASLTAFLASCLFDCPLEVPRLAALFYLVAFAGMLMGEDRA